MTEEFDKKSEKSDEAVLGADFGDTDNFKSELEKINKERDEYLDGWKRAKAEFINFKKEEAERLKEVARFSIEDVVRDMIIILDSFDLAIAALSKELDTPAGKGVYMIRSQFEDALKKRGLERIISPVGHPFDPVLHEAVAAVPSDEPAEVVIDEVERGYTLNGRVIRPARVVVSNGTPSAEESE